MAMNFLIKNSFEFLGDAIMPPTPRPEIPLQIMLWLGLTFFKIFKNLIFRYGQIYLNCRGSLLEGWVPTRINPTL